MKKNKTSELLFTMLIAYIVSSIITNYLFCNFTEHSFKIYCFAKLSALNGIAFIISASISASSTSSSLNNIKTADAGDGQHGTASFMTDKEKIKNYKINKIGKETDLGFVIGYTHKNDYIIDDSDKNIIIEAPPGSGKTKSVILNNILFNLSVHNNTSKWQNMILVSLKNDLYDLTAHELMQEGINVAVINIRNPLKSLKFNPMKQINCFMEQKQNNNNHIKHLLITAGIKQEDYIPLFKNLDLGKGIQKQLAALNLDSVLSTEINEFLQKSIKCYSNAEKYAKILASTIINSVDDGKSGADKFFTNTAQGLIAGLIIIVSEMGMSTGVDKRNLISVFKLIIDMNGLSEESSGNVQKSIFGEVMGGIPEHRVNFLAGASVSADSKTSMNVFSTALSELTEFIDSEMEQMLISGDNEFSLEDYFKNKSAVYLILPDEDPTKHFLGSLFYRIIYNTAIVNAEEQVNGRLKYPILNLHDEFGNFPAIKDYDVIVNATRSRGIKNVAVLQSMHQLKKKYGDKTGTVIQSSFQISIFGALPPTDDEGLKNLSNRLGNRTISTASKNTGSSSNGGGFFSSSTSRGTTHSLMARPLMTHDEISNMKIGEWLILETGKKPQKNKMILASDIWDLTEKHIEFESSMKDTEYMDVEELKRAINSKYCLEFQDIIKNIKIRKIKNIVKDSEDIVNGIMSNTLKKEQIYLLNLDDKFKGKICNFLEEYLIESTEQADNKKINNLIKLALNIGISEKDVKILKNKVNNKMKNALSYSFLDKYNNKEITEFKNELLSEMRSNED